MRRACWIIALCGWAGAGAMACGDPGATWLVTRSGDADGRVASLPDGIHCGTTCGLTLPIGTSVVLTAIVSDEASGGFVGWTGGGCTGTETCTIVLSEDV